MVDEAERAIEAADNAPLHRKRKAVREAKAPLALITTRQSGGFTVGIGQREGK
jgi:hypothetical protein